MLHVLQHLPIVHIAMRNKVEDCRKHTARGVSLPPEMEAQALKRCATLDVSFSKYVQKLIKIDLARKLLKEISA